jgi:hypothetical protein
VAISDKKAIADIYNARGHFAFPSISARNDASGMTVQRPILTDLDAQMEKLIP